MRLRIWVDLDGAAFDEEDGDGAYEACRVARRAAEEVSAGPLEIGRRGALRDVNGNTCGGWLIDEEDHDG
jgi:hypothetical protein